MQNTIIQKKGIRIDDEVQRRKRNEGERNRKKQQKVVFRLGCITHKLKISAELLLWSDTKEYANAVA